MEEVDVYKCKGHFSNAISSHCPGIEELGLSKAGWNLYETESRVFVLSTCKFYSCILTLYIDACCTGLKIVFTEQASRQYHVAQPHFREIF